MIGYLHIGLEKTGTTTIQHFLHWNRELLSRNETLYPASINDPSYGHLFLSACAQSPDKIGDIRLGLGIIDLNSLQSYRKRALANLTKEIADQRRRPKRLIFSNEHLHGSITTADEVFELRNILTRFCDIHKVIAYVARQDRLASSLYSTIYKHGTAGHYPVFQVLDEFWSHYYNYDRVLNLYAEAFGSDNIEVHIFDKAHLTNGDLLEDLCAALDLRLEGSYFRPPRINRSLSLKALAFLAEFNRHVPFAVDGSVNRERERVSEIFEALFSRREKAASRRQAKAFCSQFADSNERVRQKYLPSIAAPLFDENFDDYPELEPAFEQRYEDAVAIAAEVWKYFARERMKAEGPPR